MADVINLNRARKEKARTAARSLARENRIRFGRTRAEKIAEAKAAAKLLKTVDGAKRDQD